MTASPQPPLTGDRHQAQPQKAKAVLWGGGGAVVYTKRTCALFTQAEAFERHDEEIDARGEPPAATWPLRDDARSDRAYEELPAAFERCDVAWSLVDIDCSEPPCLVIIDASADEGPMRWDLQDCLGMGIMNSWTYDCPDGTVQDLVLLSGGVPEGMSSAEVNDRMLWRSRQIRARSSCAAL